MYNKEKNMELHIYVEVYQKPDSFIEPEIETSKLGFSFRSR
jgi:hypothetical protein